jgi:hypothetical protein
MGFEQFWFRKKYYERNSKENTMEEVVNENYLENSTDDSKCSNNNIYIL